MANVPAKIASRISEGLKRFQPIIESARVRDVNESDTVVLMTGILSEILGFDKYTDITTELSIRGTYCDLALKINDKISLLLEAKAIGLDLKENHVKQAVDYAANKGIEWVILSNAVTWKVFKVVFSKPIQNILVCEIDLSKLRHKAQEDIELLYVLSKEAISKASLDEFFTQKQATNKYMIGNLLGTDAITHAIRKELKQIYPDIRVNTDEIKNVLLKEVIKREILEGEEAEEARKKITRTQRKKERAQQSKQESGSSAEVMTSTTESETTAEPMITATAETAAGQE